MAKPSHIFIVGSYRSGTTLVLNILNSSKDVAICGETFFFGHLISSGFRQTFANVGDISTDAGARKVVDYIYNIRVVSFWHWIQENVDREEFLRGLLESDRTDRALFDLAMAFYADGKPIRGEKTPAHIHYVPTLLEWFPGAKIIHTFRDPRAIFVSEYKKKSKQKNAPRRFYILRRSELALKMYLSLHVLITWLRVVQLHHRYQRLYPNNYYFVKYEELIRDPKTQLQELCNFLEIDFTDVMLQQTVVNSSFVARQDQVQGFDATAIERWRKYIPPAVNRWLVLWCKKYLFEFGYQL
jgi:hypothetical protein